MRIEIEQNASPSAIYNNAETSGQVQDRAGINGLLDRAKSAAKNGDRKQARALLTEVTDADPHSVDAWLWLASVSEYPEELVGFLNNVLEIEPEHEKALSWMASTRKLIAKTFVQRSIDSQADGRTSFALDCLDKALEHDPECESAWFWRASFSTDPAERMNCLERVLEINPANADARAALDGLNVSLLTEQLDRSRRALAADDQDAAGSIVNQVLSMDPVNLEALMLWSQITSSANERHSTYKKILECDPENALAKMGVAILTCDPQKDVENIQLAESVPEPLSDPSFDMADVRLEFEDDFHAEGIIDELPPEPTFEEVSEVVPDRVVEYVPSLHVESTIDAEYSEPAEQSIEPVDEPAVLTGLAVEETNERSYEVPFEAPADAPTVEATVETAATLCPYCQAEYSQQAFQCASCNAVLTLSDIELLLAGGNPENEPVRHAVDAFEAISAERELNESELYSLAIGNLNLRNWERGLECLRQASALSPNNVVLSAQVNTLAIRLDEMQRQQEIHDAMPRGKNILVVDDSATVRKLISSKLEKSGHNVVCAADGVEALELFGDYVPDLVLLDIAMPRMDGYAVCKEIRANESIKHVPIVMISGKDGFFDKVRGRMAGTTAYITKPFGPETLMRALETYLLPDAEIELAEVEN